jgi:hypothetical protein
VVQKCSCSSSSSPSGSSCTRLKNDAFTADEIITEIIEFHKEMMNFIQNKLGLGEFQARYYYRELLEVSLVFLGSSPSRGVKFRALEPMQHVRWMSKGINTLKVCMYLDPVPPHCP